MTDRPQSLRELYADAEAKKADLDSAASTNTATYQENLSTTIAQYTTCLDLIDRLALFSPNESLEDISTQDLKSVSSPPPFHYPKHQHVTHRGQISSYPAHTRRPHPPNRLRPSSRTRPQCTAILHLISVPP